MLPDAVSNFHLLLTNNVSVDELRKLLSDKDAYQNLLFSLEPVKTQNRVSSCSYCFVVPHFICTVPVSNAAQILISSERVLECFKLLAIRKCMLGRISSS